jgi:hypothetical protein
VLGKGDRKDMPRKRTSYSALSEERKDKIYKKAREAYEQKEALVKKTTRNEQMIAPLIPKTSEEPSIPYHVASNIEKSNYED